MKQLVVFLEEPSAKAMLQGLLPRLLGEHINVHYIVFDGKQDLEKHLLHRMRAWQNPQAFFLVMRDQDSRDCRVIKQKLLTICHMANRTENSLVRIACRELESFYLGDLRAVATALGLGALEKQQDNKKYRNPDRLNNAAQELKRIAKSYQKLSGSREIGKHLSLRGNRSGSFNQLLCGLRKLFGEGL